MNHSPHDIIISGVNMELTDAIKQVTYDKVAKLFEHEGHIIRLRVELEYDKNRSHEKEFSAKGHIEIKGPPLIVCVSSDDLYKSIDQMVIRLDRMLRRRSRLRNVKRKQTHSVEIPAEIPKAKIA